MRANYDKVAALTVSPDLKAKAWENLLGNYKEKNPYSDEDEALRSKASAALEEARRQAQQLADGAERAARKAKPKAPSNVALQGYEPEMVAIPGKNYEMGKFEVTQAQWRAVMGGDPPELRFKGCDDCPVEKVSWDDVQRYLAKLNQMSGRQYRLPTENEWKYACDGGESHTYCGGEDLDGLGWYDGNSGSKTHPVGQKRANGYGLYDMTGNVWEWSQDCYDDCSVRVLRGGSWGGYSESAHAADSVGNLSDERNCDFGFRLVRSARTN